MFDQQIFDYILQAQKHGLADFEIKQNLLNAGWEAAAVEESFVHAKAVESQAASGLPPAAPDYPQFQQPLAQSYQQTPVLQTRTSVFTQVPPQTVASGIALSEQHFQNSAASGGNVLKKPLLWITVLVICLLAGGAYGYYNYYYTTPLKVWSQLSQQKPKTFQANYSFAYSGNQASSSPGFALSVSGNGNYDFSDANNLKTSQNVNVNLGAANLSYKLDFNYLMLGQVLYVDVSQIDLLKQLMPGQTLQWLKLDLNELRQYIAQNSSSTQVSESQFNDPKLKAKLQAIWSSGKILTPGTFLAREKIGQTAVYHIKPQLNTNAASQAVWDSLEALAAAQASSTGQLTDQDKQILSGFISKIKIKEFDIWVGQKDGYVYKFHLISNAPSQNDFSNQALANGIGPLNEAQTKARDAKRLADVRQIESALELYNNDYGGYPGSQNGNPLNLSPKYIGVFPTAPEPADGNCTDYYNTYWYKAEGQPKTINGQTVYPSFSMTFCLSQPTGGYSAAINTLTPQGIKSNITCNDTPEHCVNPNPGAAASSAALTAINQMDFNGQIAVDVTYSNYGKAQTFTAPDNALDIIQNLQQQVKGTIPAGALPNQTINSQNTQANSNQPAIGADAQRLKDMMQLASALEDYANKNSYVYPDNLQQLVPAYLSKVPTAPTPPGGNCTAAQNTYSYQPKHNKLMETFSTANNNDYLMTFCLGSTTESYAPGVHTLSPEGLQ